MRSGLLHHNVNATKLYYACVDARLNRLPNTDVAEQPKTSLVPPLHLLGGVLHRPTDRCHIVPVTESRLDQGPANVARRAKDQPCFLTGWVCVRPGRGYMQSVKAIVQHAKMLHETYGGSVVEGNRSLGSVANRDLGDSVS